MSQEAEKCFDVGTRSGLFVGGLQLRLLIGMCYTATGEQHK